jgi:NADPH2:quinone reductase
MRAMRAIVVEEQGGPEVLAVADVPDPTAAEGQAVVRLDAAGVNFIDVNQRSGAYRASVPFVPGSEGAGTVAAVGAGVEGLAVGDRVGFAAGVTGAYAEATAAPAERLVPIPDDVPTETAAAVLLQGMTAHYLVHSVCPLEDGDWCVVHAAAGGVGRLLVQLAAARGLRVIGTTSTAAKAEEARSAGAEDVVVRTERSLPDVVAERTGGRGVRVVFESIGRDTIDDSFASLARRGHLVVFGQSSGAPDPIPVRRLQQGGSLFVTRPGLIDYTATRDELLWRADEVLSAVADGRLDVRVHDRLPLERAAEAHRALESGTTTGKLLLVP